jgi:signal transduction histidine kinase
MHANQERSDELAKARTPLSPASSPLLPANDQGDRQALELSQPEPQGALPLSLVAQVSPAARPEPPRSRSRPPGGGRGGGSSPATLPLLLQPTLEALPAAAAVIDGQRRIVATNRAWREQQAELGEAFTGTVLPESGTGDPDAAAIFEGQQAILAGERVAFQRVHRAEQAGKERTFELRLTRIATPDDQVVLLVDEEITGRVEAEKALRRLTAQLMRAQDEERRSIARELHDATAQNLTAILLATARLRGALEGTESLRELVVDVERITRQTLDETRTLSYLLHPPLLSSSGLVAALREYVMGFARRSGLDVQLEADDVGALPEESELALYRAAQEALVNVHRHSGSSTARVSLRREGGSIVLRVEDDGRGLPDQGPSAGVGLSGMRERLRHLGGDLDLRHGEKGLTVVAVVPWAPARSQER